MLGLLSGFLVKHMIADYYLQYSWMIKDKGNYNAIGGIAHSGLHAIFTFIILYLFGLGFWLPLLLAGLDYVLHYHIDYIKSNIWRKNNYGPNDQMYWIVHGTAQFLHMMTYVLIIWIVLSGLGHN